MKDIKKVAIIIIASTTFHYVLLCAMIGEKQRITERKLDKIIELLKHNK